MERSTLIHNGNYDYTLVNFNSSRDKVDIVCPDHGVFNQRVHSHLSGSGCPSCAIRDNKEAQSMGLSEFIDKVSTLHEGRYSYGNTKYSGIKGKVEIICPVHGPFLHVAEYHLRGTGCPRCNNKVSSGEQRLFDKLLRHIPDLVQSDRTVLDGREIDIYSPSLQIAVEFNGVYWHNSLHKGKHYHKNKYKDCRKKGIKLIQVLDVDWENNEEKIIDHILSFTKPLCEISGPVISLDSKSLLGLTRLIPNTENKCVLRYGLEDGKDAVLAYIDFCNSGDCSEWSICGIYSKNNDLSLYSKIFKFFKGKHKPSTVTVESLNDYSDDDIYISLGFTNKGSNPAPVFYYPRGGELRHKKRIVNGVDTYYTIWTSGTRKWEWKSVLE